MPTTLLQSDLPGLPLRHRGKVRDVFDIPRERLPADAPPGDYLLMVATDRLSAFDVVLPDPIPDEVLARVGTWVTTRSKDGVLVRQSDAEPIEVIAVPETKPVEPTGERFPLDTDGLRLLAPVIPSKIYGLAKNYEAHAQFMHETGHSDIAHAPENMVIFSKPSTSVIGPDDPIVIPPFSHDMNFEPEVAVIIGRIAKNVPVEKAMDYVLGFTCVNDVTLRDLQGADPMWTRAKGFDTACPLGPWIQTDLNWKDAKISFTLNGEDVELASGTTANLIHGIPEQIAAISSFTTLLPGDVILTGTPNASGHLDPGDEAIVHVEGIGSLRNVVVRG